MDFKIEWDENKAVRVQISHMENATNVEELSIHLENHPQQRFLGNWSIVGSVIEFTPVVPFTPGNTYEVYAESELIGSFTIEIRDKVTPQVVAVYPTKDTLPENLLKMFIEFSIPMSEGEAYRNLTFLDLTSGDTLNGTFLELEPELWNKDNTLLTLWLDPGRIKRGLIPNLERGAPLEVDNNYRLVISKDWRGANGLRLSSNYTKDFYTVLRDSISPDPETWKFVLPEINSREKLQIEFNESLDAVLVLEALVLLDSDGNVIPGVKFLGKRESVFEFKPDSEWVGGDYFLRIESRLEDLAGNNINRLFEEPISPGISHSVNKESIEIQFSIL